ncbi:MAG TPA: surface carbohydrate biosynthesis protein [Rhizomicrobium sp.]|nr:surface carbohydrate biosynthesis protein [Rhizomicrobium sp.]
MTALAFLPVLTKARELDSRILFAAVLARRGYRVLLGGREAINAAAAASRDGLYVCPLLAPQDGELLARLRAQGHAIIGWHEEGLVYPDPQWYFRNRLSGETASRSDAIAMWGRRSAGDLARAWPELRVPVLPLGNPRIDVLREPFRQIYTAEAARLRERFGPYVLVNTNFDLVNHIDGPDWLIESLRRRRWHEPATYLPTLERWWEFRRATFEAFLAGIPELHAALPETTIVIRPHPSESAAPWRALESRHERVVVAEPASAVAPWILGAAAVLHNSCTTAVEAFLLDRPAIALVDGRVEPTMESPLPNALSRKARSWAEAAELVRRAAHGDGGWTSEAQRALADEHLALSADRTSCERIADLARGLGVETRCGQLASPQSLALSLPLLFERAKPYARPLVRPFRRRLRDGRTRFDGLRAGEVEEKAAAIGAIMGCGFRVEPYARDIVVLRSGRASAAQPATEAEAVA